MNKRHITKALLLAAPLALTMAGAETAAAIDPAPIAQQVVTTVGGVMAAGAGILAVSVGGRVAVRWVKRLAGFA